MRRAIKTCKHYYCYGCSINTTDFPIVNVYVTDYMLMNYRLLELGSINCVRDCPQT